MADTLKKHTVIHHQPKFTIQSSANMAEVSQMPKSNLHARIINYHGPDSNHIHHILGDTTAATVSASSSSHHLNSNGKISQKGSFHHPPSVHSSKGVQSHNSMKQAQHQ